MSPAFFSNLEFSDRENLMKKFSFSLPYPIDFLGEWIFPEITWATSEHCAYFNMMKNGNEYEEKEFFLVDFQSTKEGIIYFTSRFHFCFISARKCDNKQNFLNHRFV